jgi:hypothetical protein
MKKRRFSLVIFVFLLFVACSSTDNEKELSQEAKDFASEHYSVERQHQVEELMIEAARIIDGDEELHFFYNSDYFRLAEVGTDHFYEEIGKYHKFIFGWDDWYEKYAEYGIQWAFDLEGIYEWLGNYPTNPNCADSVHFDAPFSENRKIYNELVRDYFE